MNLLAKLYLRFMYCDSEIDFQPVYHFDSLCNSTVVAVLKFPIFEEWMQGLWNIKIYVFASIILSLKMSDNSLVRILSSSGRQ
jgi:hypothetical protein